MIGYCGIDKTEVNENEDCKICPKKEIGYTCLYYHDNRPVNPFVDKLNEYLEEKITK